MAYRYGDRNQSALFPPCVDDFVPKDAAVRAYDAMVEALDFKELGIELDPDNVGNPQYDPKAMLKLHIYGTAYGIRSSRKLEREVYYVEAVSDNNDLNQFASQIDQANHVLKEPCKTACADSGYSSTEELTRIDKKDITVIVPSQQQASGKERGEFHKSRFLYDEANNRYICPEGYKLEFYHPNTESKSDVYRMSDPKRCRECRHFGHCAKSKQGRQINRLWNEKLRLKFEAQYRQPEAQAVYKLRRQKSEHPFGHIKRNLKFDSFLMRGRDGANAEITLAAVCFNMARMITILGIPALIQKLQG